jgi:hypothetical protein
MVRRETPGSRGEFRSHPVTADPGFGATGQTR